MVVKRERAHPKIDHIHPSVAGISNLRVESLDRVGGLGLGIRTQVVKEYLNLDLALVAALFPTWVGAEDGHTVGSYKTSNCCNSDE